MDLISFIVGVVVGVGVGVFVPAVYKRLTAAKDVVVADAKTVAEVIASNPKRL